MIFKQETIQSWFSGVESSINNEVIQPFQNAEQVIWKYNQAIQHNSLTQQGWERLLAQSDDSLKAYLTSIKGTTATMTGYNVSLQGNIIGFKKVSSAITQYNALSASGTKEQNMFANAVSVTNGKLGTYLTGLNGAKASIGGYVVSLVGATVKTVALKVATIALNSAITMGASLIISGLVSAISEWIHKTENMISASEDAIEKIKSINDELKNNQKTISDTAKRYAELAQGVDQLTGKNISLSNEDYEEFLTLSNQLAEMFPTLTRNYNDNGDAIVQLSGDVDTIVGSLQNLIEAQRDLANRQIVDELPTVFDGVAAKSDKYEQQLSDLESRRDTLVKSLGDVQSEEFSSNFMDGFSNKWIEISGNNLEVISQMRDDYMKILEEANIDFEELTPTYEMKDGIEVPVGFTIKINSSDEDVEKAKNTIDGKIQELASQYETDINKLNEEINTTNEKNKANWTSLSSSIFAWLSTDDSFKVMDDTMQATVQNIVNSLDWGSLDFSSWEDAKQYIQENILSLFNTSEGKETLADIEVMFGIQTQFNNGDITVEQYQQKLQDFLNSIENLPPETKKSILLLFGIQTNDDGTTTSNVDTMVENVKKKLEGAGFDKSIAQQVVQGFSKDELQKIAASENIDWSNITEGITDDLKNEDWYAVTEGYKNAVDECEEYVKSLPDYYKQYGNINNVDREIIRWTKENVEKYKDILEQWNIDYSDYTPDDWSTVLGWAEKVPEMDDLTVALTAMLQTENGYEILTPDSLYDYLSDVYQKASEMEGGATAENILKVDKDGIIEDINGIETHVSGMIAAVEGQVVNGAKLTYDDVMSIGGNYDNEENVSKRTFDSMHTIQAEALYSKKAYEELNDEAKKTGETADDLIRDYDNLGNAASIARDRILEVIDVSSNPDEITDSFSYDKLSDIPRKLAEVENAYKTAQEALDSYNEKGYYSLDVIDSILSLEDEYINVLVDQNGQLQINESSMNQLAKIKIEAAKASIYQETCEELVRIKTLDTSLAAQELALVNGTLTKSAYETAKALYEEVVAMGGANAALANNVWDSATKKVKLLDNQLKSLNSGSYDVGKSAMADSAKKATEDAEKATKEYIESYMDYMEKSLESGRIDYHTYSRDVAKFLKDMYDQGKIAAKDYHDYTKEMLEVQKSIYDKAISGMVYILDQEIDRLDEEKELIRENYESKIQSIQSEIDLLNEANDQRKTAMELEEAEYNLQRARQQKVNGIYTADKGKIYTADSSAIRDAEDEVAQRKNDIKISQLESQIKSLEDAMESETKAIDDQIAKYEEYKEQIQDVADAYENAENVKYALAVTGLSSETEILQCRTDVLNTFKDNYIAIQQAIADAAWASANEQIEAAKEAEKAAQGNIGSADKIGGDTPTIKGYQIVDTVTGKTTDFKTEGSASQKLASLNAYELDSGRYYIKKKYASGTKNAKKGLNLVGEDGIETYIDNDGNVSLVTKPTLIPMEGGEIVKNEKETKSLLDSMNLVPIQTGDIWKKFAGNMPDLSSMMNVNVPDYSKISGMVSKSQTIEQHNQFNVTLPNITDSTKATKLFEELQRLPLDALQYANTRKK